MKEELSQLKQKFDFEKKQDEQRKKELEAAVEEQKKELEIRKKNKSCTIL